MTWANSKQKQEKTVICEFCAAQSLGRDKLIFYVVSLPANSGILILIGVQKDHALPFLLHLYLPCSLCLCLPFSHICPNFQSEDAHPGTSEAYILIACLSETLFQLPSFPYLSNHSIPSSISSHMSVFQHCFPALSSWHYSKLFRNNYRVCTSDWSVSVWMESKNLSVAS